MSLSYNFLKRIVLTLFFVGIATNAMAKICFLPGLDKCDNGQLRDDPIVSCSSYNGYDDVTDCQKNLPASQICTLNNGCHYRVCQYNSQDACLKNIAENQKCVEDTDTSCYYRVKKTCVEINEIYINLSEKNKKGDSYKCSEKAEGEDGKCFLCTKKKCSDYNIPGSIVKDSCDTKIYDVEETDWTDGESTRKCVKCTLKSCTKLTPAHSVKGTCKSNQTETDAGVSGSEGPCVDCVDNSYVITVTDTPTIKQTENYGYNITVKRKVTTTGTKTVNVASTGKLNGLNKTVRNNSTWYIRRYNDETGKATSKNDIKWSRMGVTINNITVANVPLTDNNPLKACEPKENIKATDGTYRVICQYGGIGKPTCEKINSNYKSSGECADGEKVDAGIYDADGNKCFYCKKTEDSDQICIKLAFKCTDTTGKHTCTATELKSMGIVMTLEDEENANLHITNPTKDVSYSFNEDISITNSENSFCFSRQELTDSLDEFEAAWDNDGNSHYIGAYPLDVIRFKPVISDSYVASNPYTFVNTDPHISTGFTVLRRNNQIKYAFNTDTEASDAFLKKYGQCFTEIAEDKQSYPTSEEMYDCTWKDIDTAPLSSTINMEINLIKLTGAKKCIYYAATCYHLPQNGKTDGRLEYRDVKYKYSNTYGKLGQYYGLDSNDGFFIVPNYPNQQIAKDCIDSAEITVADSGVDDRINTSYTMTQMTTEELASKYSETQNNFFNPKKNTVILQSCELQDWDRGEIVISANSSYTNYFDGYYNDVYIDDFSNHECAKGYSFEGAYYDMENNKVKVPFTYLEQRTCATYSGLPSGPILIAEESYLPENGNFPNNTYKEYKFAYSGGYVFLNYDNLKLQEYQKVKSIDMPAQTSDIYKEGTLYPSGRITATAGKNTFNVHQECPSEEDFDSTYYTISSDRPLTTIFSIRANGEWYFNWNHKGYTYMTKTSGTANNSVCDRYINERAPQTNTPYSLEIPEFDAYGNNYNYNNSLDYDYMITDDNYFYYHNKVKDKTKN